MNYQIIVDNSNSLTDILTTVAALVTAIVAFYGVWEWKRQLKGKTDYEVARRYLKSSLKLRDAMKYVRNPFISVEEMQMALKENGFAGEEYSDHQKTNRAVYSFRWRKVIEAWTDLEVELLDAEVSWGIQAIEAQKPLDALARKLRAAVNLFLEGHSKRGEEELIYDMGDKDLFSQEISIAIEKIKNYLKPHLE